MPGATSLHGWHRFTLRYFPGVCPRMTRLSLLCLCQMNHKPIPYAIAICWWAQAVLVDIKSRDYGGLILSEWTEKRRGRQRAWRGTRWRQCYPLCPPIGPHVSSHREVEGRAADWHLPNCLICRKLWGISSTCWFVEANKQLHEHTDNNMFVTLSPVSYGGNWSGCQKQRDQSLLGIMVAVILLFEIESITNQPIITVVGAQALALNEVCLLTKGEEFLDAARSFDCSPKPGIKGFVCTCEDEHFCFSFDNTWNLKSSRHFLFTAVLLIASDS